MKRGRELSKVKLRFVHAADLHLDSPFRGIRSKTPDHVSDTLYRSTFDAYQAIIDLCINEEVDALLVAGDVYDGADRSLRAQLKFFEGLKQLSKAGIRSFVCHGNHDPLDGWEARLDPPTGCSIFQDEVTGEPVFPTEPDRAMVYGISYPRREVHENLVPRFGDVPAGGFNIGLLHANVNYDPDHDPYAPCTIKDLEETSVDYWALGHIHTHRILRQEMPAIVYPGNPQGRHPRESGARGVYLVEVANTGKIDIRFRSVDVVRWETVEVDIGGLGTEQELFDAIEQKVFACQEEAEGRPVVFRLRLSGRGGLHRSLVHLDFVDDLLESLNDFWGGERPWLWCDSIRLATGTALDREQLLSREDFLGDLVRLSAELQGDPDYIAELPEVLRALYDRSVARPYLRDYRPSDNELRQLIAEAEKECLASLVGEEESS